MQNLDVGVGDEIRVSERDRGQDEETQGETQTTKGFVFPQHLKRTKKVKL